MDARRAFAAEPWNLNEPLHVRMVLHSTEAIASGGDYVGGGLNRLGRLLAACHGGQTLLSQAAEQLARDYLPTNVTLLDLGQHRLRDLVRPDRIFQLVIAGLRTDFPPHKSLDAIPNYLPAPLTSFVGRTRELEQVVARLSGPAPAVITAPARSAPAAYGKYVATFGECRGCHGPDMTGSAAPAVSAAIPNPRPLVGAISKA